MLYSTRGIFFVCNNACVLLIEYVLFGKHCLNHYKIKWPHTEFVLLKFSYELLLIFGLSCKIQSTPCEHWTTVNKIVFFNSQRKASKLVSVKINNGGTRTLVDSDILNIKDVLWPPKNYALIENKTVYIIWYIFY